MKPLRDIGTLITPSPDSVTQFEPFVQMTLEERRELAQECIERYLQRLHEIHAFTSAPSIDEFLDGEGV